MIKITLEIPEDVLVEALHRLPQRQRLQILQRIESPSKTEPKWIKAKELDKITGLISIGGNAVEDAERVYDD